MDYAKIKNRLPIIIVVMVIFVSMGFFMVHYADERVKDNLLKEFAVIDSLCQGATGCPSVPEGWEKKDCPDSDVLAEVKVCASPSSSSAYKALVYKASSDEFFAWWSYVSDAYIQVNGGKNKKMTIEEFAIKK